MNRDRMTRTDNGRTNGGATNHMMPGGARGDELMNKIRELCFVKAELELYLDTHPRCRTALDYYYKTLTELEKMREEYRNTVGPITADDVVSQDKWTWVEMPWPWMRSGDYMQPREDK